MEQKGNKKKWGGRAWGGNVGAHTLDTRGTGAVEAHPVTGAGAARPAGLGFTGIGSEALAASGATPARLTHAAEPGGDGSQGTPVGGRQQGSGGWGEASPSGRIMADTVTARFLGTGMARGEAERGQGAGRAEAAESIFPIHAGASITARAGRTLVDLHVAKGP